MTDPLERISDEIAGLRSDHVDEPLEIDHLDEDPLVQFARWLDEALDAQPWMPNVMTLATADASGRPSARVVLLKGIARGGFEFYTNHSSRKGSDLEENPAAALVFYWPALERQVAVRGPVERLDPGSSEEYFRTRPRGSQLGAWASDQSRPLESRAALEERVARMAERFPDEIPLPEHWGGYRLVPEVLEFWKSRSDRLHDRFAYERDGDAWRITRLYP